MPRQDPLLTPEHYDDWQTDRWYLMEVVEVTRSKRPKGIRVSLRAVDEDLEGKLTKGILPARLLPKNRTGKFLEAAGLNIAGQGTVDCGRAVEAVVEVRFGLSVNGAELEPVEFRPASRNQRPAVPDKENAPRHVKETPDGQFTLES